MLLVSISFFLLLMSGDYDRMYLERMLYEKVIMFVWGACFGCWML